MESVIAVEIVKVPPFTTKLPSECTASSAELIEKVPPSIITFTPALIPLAELLTVLLLRAGNDGNIAIRNQCIGLG
jgi:hypothetical protein